MTFRSLKTIVFPALAVLAIGFSVSALAATKAPSKAQAPAAPASAPAPAPAALTKAEVEKIIHDYIVDNPTLILQSVDNYQKKIMASAQDAALEKNWEALFKSGSSPQAGNPQGDVTVVEFMDYSCHYCKITMPTILSVLGKDPQVRFMFKDFPILGPASETAAKWALAAHKQGKYFDFHKAMMSNKTPITDALLEKIAREIGLNLDQAKKDAASEEVAKQIGENQALAASLGLSGTPAFVIGKEVIAGALPADEMEKKISDIRAAQKAAKK